MELSQTNKPAHGANKERKHIGTMKNRITQTNRLLPAGRMISVAATVALLIATSAPALPDLDGDNDTGPGLLASPDLITPPFVQTRPYGLTYGQWAAKYWQWTLSFPATADPASDTAPPESGQTGPVWFLAGAHGSALVNGRATVTRQITVPEGKALFFPVLSVFYDNTGCPDYNSPLLTPPQLVTQVLDIWNSVASAAFCTIDGVPVSGLANPITSPYLIQSSPFFYVTAPHHNLLAAAFGEPCIADGTRVGPAVAEGLFLMVPPLAAGGPHTIRFGGFEGPTARPMVALDITYNITVTPANGRNSDRTIN